MLLNTVQILGRMNRNILISERSDGISMYVGEGSTSEEIQNFSVFFSVTLVIPALTELPDLFPYLNATLT